MSFTVTSPTWLLPAWLAVGVVLWLPLEYAAYQQTNNREGFWRSGAKRARQAPWRSLRAVVTAVLVWPLAVYEVVRWPVKKRWRRIRQEHTTDRKDA